jgi:hypothetical protein
LWADCLAVSRRRDSRGYQELGHLAKELSVTASLFLWSTLRIVNLSSYIQRLSATALRKITLEIALAQCTL